MVWSLFVRWIKVAAVLLIAACLSGPDQTPDLAKRSAPAAPISVPVENIPVPRYEYPRHTVSVSGPYRTSLDFTKSWENHLTGLGCDWKAASGEKQFFPIQGKGIQKQDLFILHLDQDLSDTNVRMEVDVAGYEPVGFPWLVAFGTAHKELLDQFSPIVARGTEKPTGRGLLIAGLDGGPSCSLTVFGITGDPLESWGGNLRFLCRKKA